MTDYTLAYSSLDASADELVDAAELFLALSRPGPELDEWVRASEQVLAAVRAVRSSQESLAEYLAGEDW